MNHLLKVKVALAVGLGLVVGVGLGRGCSLRLSQQDAEATVDHAAHPQAEVWTCSMHPQIRQSTPGQCPICGMDLIRVEMDASPTADAPRQITLSPAARQLAEVVEAPVERRSVAVEVRLAGKVEFDETRMAIISPRVDGRIDRLMATYVGMPVSVGDPLADLYSPEWVAAQQELLQVLSAASESESFSPLLGATRERLRRWGLTDEQVAEIERSGQVRDHMTFVAPLGGIVVAKDAREGQYVTVGQPLFSVADLSRVWVQFAAYESDLAWLRLDQPVEFQVEAYPGETFRGTIAFIAPLLDPATRTVKVRVEVENTDGRLKTEMFARGIVRSSTGESSGELPLVIPATAPLVTGKRAVVYVAVPEQTGAYEGREVELGPRAGDYYIVRSGVQEGETVVVNGAFKIDSSLQIQGKPSMMAPASDSIPADHFSATQEITTGSSPIPDKESVPPEFRGQLEGLLAPVLAIGSALAHDDLAAAQAQVLLAQQAVAAADAAPLAPEEHMRWMALRAPLATALDGMANAPDLKTFRTSFALLAPAMVQLIKQFGLVHTDPIYDLRCPMAADHHGATWLQSDAAVRNPYFGRAMFTCGSVIETLEPQHGSEEGISGR